MASRSEFKNQVRKILENHGIGDKDKLEHIPEAVTLVYGNAVVEMMMDFAKGQANGDVEVFFARKHLDGPTED